MRLIDANALIAEMHNVILEDGEDRRTFYEVIERQPTIEERKRGKWIDGDVLMCSECGRWIDVLQGDADMNFCPNCGCRMVGDSLEKGDSE